jgi:hypothetical protein
MPSIKPKLPLNQYFLSPTQPEPEAPKALHKEFGLRRSMDRTSHPAVSLSHTAYKKALQPPILSYPKIPKKLFPFYVQPAKAL